jgi:hypothetical protein
MKNNKQQTAVDIIYQGISDKIVMQDLNKALICIHISHDDFLKLHKQAKEMEKEQMKEMEFLKFQRDVYIKDIEILKARLREAEQNLNNKNNETKTHLD